VGAEQAEAAGELTAEVGEGLELAFEGVHVVRLAALDNGLQDLVDGELRIPAKAIHGLANLAVGQLRGPPDELLLPGWILQP